MFFNEYYEHLKELQEALAAPSKFSSVADFLNQSGKSPYILLQILICGLIGVNSIGAPATDFNALNNDVSLLTTDKNKEKTQYLMTKTNLPIDFNRVFKEVFPNSVQNPMVWAKENASIVGDANNPDIQKIIKTIVNKYSDKNTNN